MVRTETQPIRAKLPLKNLKIHPLDSNNVLITYVSEVQFEELELANRCSVWSRTKEGWQLRFHQGTPTTIENMDIPTFLWVAQGT
jgi:hypothetical protein